MLSLSGAFILLPVTRISPVSLCYRGTRAAILGEGGEEPWDPNDDDFDGLGTENSSGSVGSSTVGYAEVEGTARGSSVMRRTDGIAERQARHPPEASTAGVGWPPPHTHGY